MTKDRPHIHLYIYNRWHNVFAISVFKDQINSPQVKRNLKSSTKNFAYKLRQNMPNNLRRFRILGNEKEKRKSQYEVKIRASVQFPLRNLLLAIAVKLYAKADIKPFGYRTVLLAFLTFGRIFCHWLCGKLNICP